MIIGEPPGAQKKAVIAFGPDASQVLDFARDGLDPSFLS